MEVNNLQKTLDWYRDRLGKITGSCVSEIMKSGRGKDEVFGKTAKAYLYKLWAQRNMAPELIDDDTTFEEYLDCENPTSKAMSNGIDREPEAREIYKTLTNSNVVTQVGSFVHSQLDYFAASPDGLVEENGVVIGCLEIKSPMQATYGLYRASIKDNATLLSEKPEYFWQCMAEMACTDARWTDFIVYCPWQLEPEFITRIDRDNDAIAVMLDRVKLAEEFINNIKE